MLLVCDCQFTYASSFALFMALLYGSFLWQLFGDSFSGVSSGCYIGQSRDVPMSELTLYLLTVPMAGV